MFELRLAHGVAADGGDLPLAALRREIVLRRLAFDQDPAGFRASLRAIRPKRSFPRRSTIAATSSGSTEAARDSR